MDPNILQIVQTVMAVVGGFSILLAGIQIGQARKLARIQHTISFLIDERRRLYLENVEDLIKDKFNLSLRDIKEPLSKEITNYVRNNKQARRTVLEMLNYYEILGAAMRRKAIDSKMVSLTCGTTIRKLWLNWEPFFKESRRIQDNKEIGAQLQRMAEVFDRKSVDPILKSTKQRWKFKNQIRNKDK